VKLLRWLFGLALVAAGLLLVLVWTAPASLAYRLFESRLGPVRAEGLSGSAWQGHAERLSAFAVPLGTLDWTLEPWPLLRGVSRGDFRVAGGEVRGAARFHDAGGTLELRELHATFPARLLGPALDIPAFMFLGEVDLEVSEARVVDGVLRDARGVARWRDMGVSGLAEARLDGLEMRFAPASDAALVAELRDLGGDLAIEGRTRLEGGRFVSETWLGLRRPNPTLDEALKYVGQRLPDGRTYLRIEGEMKPLQ
jgi:general secretion pathway protein N